MKFIIASILAFMSFSSVTGQSSIKVSTPVIWSKVTVLNNYGPQREISGTARGYGATISYSIRTMPLNYRERLSIRVGVGYFLQQFHVERPFLFDSPVQPVYYTRQYAYDNISGTAGLNYNKSFSKRYSFESEIAYAWLYTFRQKYIPLQRHSSSDQPKQIEHRKYHFGNILTLSAGVKRHWQNKFAVGIDLVLPLYTQWRMDPIFEDDPSRFTKPDYGLGGSVVFSYYITDQTP